MPSLRKKAAVVTAHRIAKLTPFAARLLTEWQRLELPTSAGVIVAVSGGADSCALLLALDELLRLTEQWMGTQQLLQMKFDKAATGMWFELAVSSAILESNHFRTHYSNRHGNSGSPSR